ncbi:MAG: hypothetical protein KDH98_19225, partial [Calditrichaeota bacterium]|nr:hypothetical protein [Calditrichota bacterium]
IFPKKYHFLPKFAHCLTKIATGLKFQKRISFVNKYRKKTNIVFENVLSYLSQDLFKIISITSIGQGVCNA